MSDRRFGEGPQGPDPRLLAALRHLEEQGLAVTASNILVQVHGQGFALKECEDFVKSVMRGRRQRRNYES